MKYHFKSRQGVENFTDAEAGEMAGKNADYHREDLYNAIEEGDYPIWDVKVQIMPLAEAAEYRFNPFDLTKVWSKKDYPLVDVGYFVLNRNPRNFFAQIEQVALDPSTWSRASAFLRTRCCRLVSLLMLTSSVTALGRTTSSCRLTSR